MAGKRLLGAGAILGVVALTGGAWLAGRRVRSPAEAAASALPPRPSRLTAPVENRVLESTVITRGTVRYGDPREVVLASSSVKNGASASPPALIVSTPAVKGTVLNEGDKALEVGGRPVLILKGATPAYRDLRPGDEGLDVRQFEDALARLGFDPGAADGKYDAATQNAVDAWYRKLGYDSYGPTEAQRTSINSARDAVGTADNGVLSAKKGVEAARTGNAKDKILAADERVRSAAAKAEAAIDDARRNADTAQATVDAKRASLELARSQVTVDDAAIARTQKDAANTTSVADAENAVVDARATLEESQANLIEAQAAVAPANAAVVDAQTALDSARRDLDKARRTNATVVTESGLVQVLDNSDNVRTAEGSARSSEAALRTAQSSLATAQRAVTNRELGVTNAQRGVDRAITNVERAKNTAANPPSGLPDLRQKLANSRTEVTRLERDLQQAIDTTDNTRKQGAETIRAANAGVVVANAERGQLDNVSDLRIAQAQLVSAQAAQRRAATELASLQAKTGIVVPANEVLFFNELPLRVDDVKALRGASVTGAVMTVTTSTLAVDSSLDTAEAKLVKSGAKVTIEASEFNITLPGKVSEIASSPGTKGVDQTKVYLAVTPEADASGGVNATDLNGASVKLTIPIQSTGAAVLAVPEAAVSIGPDGAARVEVEDAADRPTRFVSVRTGLSAGGYVAVTPVAGASLKAGDQVSVGSGGSAAIEGTPGPEDSPADSVAPTTVGSSAEVTGS